LNRAVPRAVSRHQHWNRRGQTDAWGQRKCERRPEEEWIRADVPHLRIVTDEHWAAAQHARFVSAIAIAGNVEALAQALRDREHRRATWRAVLRRQTQLTRQAVSQLLDGKIVCTPHSEDRRYTFASRVKFDDVLEGTLLTRGVVPVRGFEPRFDG
jgi:hypothetical protein